MCECNVQPEAAGALAALLRDIAEALAPGNRESVVVGPVDFGPEQYTLDDPPPWINRHRYGTSWSDDTGATHSPQGSA